MYLYRSIYIYYACKVVDNEQNAFRINKLRMSAVALKERKNHLVIH